ncbi:hypothetical protein [Hydrotalea sp.]|uniref:hypothetical protein n=1 Tax=Hydrotalea sp. TaxID=2881279 RepID=UPI003D12FF80
MQDYLLEGLMIFIAVFLGFVAENVREHISDKSKEKAYMKSLYVDICSDSTAIADVIQREKIISKGQDSLLNILNHHPLSEANIDTAYQLFFKYGGVIPEFLATEKTFNQLISTGNFRLIHHPALADSISSYYDKIKSLNTQVAVVNNNTMDCVLYAQNIFKLKYGLNLEQPHKTLITTDAAMLEKYSNKLLQMSISTKFYIFYQLKNVENSCLHLKHMLEQQAT